MSHNDKPQAFIDTALSTLMQQAKAYFDSHWRFVNICGSTVEGGVELLYSFSDGLMLENLRFIVDTQARVPSITGLFPAAFFFENEVHDLFGVTFSDISIDFAGNFYKVSVPTPMNPQSVQARKAAGAAAQESGDPTTDETTQGGK
ncbi:MAG TPA: NADH dehydrogenase subunit [Coriobacteriia bacterium]|nr:NADH dehydrogenase subunit [Coriobacteriia bacterium]